MINPNVDTYSVLIYPPAQKDLDKLSGQTLSRLEATILKLSDESRPRNSIKLQGKKGEHRLRVGDYRVLYEVDDTRKRISVFRVLHRREAYR